MKLTVIIVNYNVEHFLEQCLLSVEKAVQHVATEVYVVDNRSVDGSVKMVEERFKWVHLIANAENVGFSKANNQAMRLAKGEYVLLLNPDTVVEEDTFQKVVEFMDQHADAGGLGVRMVDGKGVFLPESKRGLPTPFVSFCKISGLYRLFPRSRRFNHYYLGSIDEHETAEIEILSGAFMLMRKQALDRVGLLDEAFFMYGEDIDLSWRIILGGYKNYYLPETTIIHYKGESTKKGSLNYVFVFYNAMIIFAEKHFSEKNARVFSVLINMAIYGRAGLAILQRLFKRFWLPVVDFSALLGGLWVLQEYYARAQSKIFDVALMFWAFATYAVVWLLSVFLSGGYDAPSAPRSVFRGVFVGSLLILSGYSLLPEDMRFSRALVLLGSAWAFSWFALSRITLSRFMPAVFNWQGRRAKRIAVVGHDDEVARISNLLMQTHTVSPFVVPIGVRETDETNITFEQLPEVIRVHKIDIVVFSGRDLAAADIIHMMSATGATGVDFKIAPPDTLYMIGSNSIDTAGDLFMLETNSIHKPTNRRKKRLFDLTLSTVLLVALPVVLWFVDQKGGFLKNLGAVFSGKKTWVSYARATSSSKALPSLKAGVLTPLTGTRQEVTTPEAIDRMNLIYARDYKVREDLLRIIRFFSRLGD